MTPSAVHLSIITPTYDAVTLPRLLAWMDAKLAPGDEHVVVLDGADAPNAQWLKPWLSRPWLTVLASEPHVGDGGYTPREYAMTRCVGSHLWFMDDDDMPDDEALTTIRAAVELSPELPHLFQMRRGYWTAADNPDCDLVGRHPRLDIGMVSPQVFVVPNVPDKFGSWVNGGGYEADAEFIQQTCRRFGGFKSVSRVIAHWRPGVPEAESFVRRWSGEARRVG